MSPPSHARSSTRRRMGSGSPAREREPTAVEYGRQASGPQPVASVASTSSRARADPPVTKAAMAGRLARLVALARDDVEAPEATG